MRRLLSCVLVAFAAVWFVAFPVNASADGARLLVRFSATADASERDAAVRSIGGVVHGEIPAIGVTRVTLPGFVGDSLAALIARQPGVIWAEPDRRVTTQFTPNDALYRTDPYAGLGQWGVRTAKVDQAWDFVRGSASVIVATIDTGADPSHPDLAGVLLPGVAFLSAVSPDCRNQTSDDNSHGTHVAGIIAAQGNNSIGIAGVAFGVKVLPLKALDCVGAGMNSDIAQAIVYATDHGARIINISLGGPIGSQAILDAVRYAQSHNVLVIAAAGNCGATNPDCPFPNVADFPAAYPGVLAVGATMPDDSRAPFSTQASYLGLTAPGFRMVSTTPTYPTYLSSRGGALNYASFSGTSAAAPFVAGVAALVLSKEPNLTADQLSDRLRRTADDLGDIGPDTSFGAGRVNALRAVTAATGVTSSGYGAAYDTTAVPRAVASGAAFSAVVKITNSSTFTWSAGGANAVRLGYHWLDTSGRTIVADGVRTPLAADVPLGASVAVTANVVAPGVTGNYTLQFDLARDGVGWFSDQQVKTGDVPITITAGYGATYSPVAPGSTIVTGTPVVLNVTVANTGVRSWPAGGAQPVHLSYHWLAPDGSTAVWNGQRAAFAQDVAPGVTATVALPIVPPPGLGRFTLRLDLVEEGVTWFSAQGVPTRDLGYTVSNGFAASYSVGNVPTLLPGGRFLVPVTLQNVGIATWPAAGPAPVHLAAHLYDARGNVVAWDGARTVLASDVKAGASVSIALIVDAPLVPGTYRVQVDLVQEGVGWFSGFGSPSAPALIVVIPDYRATLPTGPITVSRSAPLTTLTVTNSSSALWSASGAAPVDISVHWLDASGAVLVWDGPRTMLGHDLAPGDAVTVAVSLGQVPAGAASVVVDLVSEGVRWFESGFARPVQFAP